MTYKEFMKKYPDVVTYNENKKKLISLIDLSLAIQINKVSGIFPELVDDFNKLENKHKNHIL